MALFSKSQNATFSGPGFSPTMLTDVQVSTQTQTVARTIATAMKTPEFESTLPVTSLSGLHINSSLGVVAGSCLTIGSGFVVSDWSVQRYWPLYPATPCTNTLGMHWEWRMPIVSGRLRGWASGDTDELAVSSSFTATFDTFGTVIADCKITGIQIGIPKRYGGSHPFSMSFQATGAITGTASLFLSATQEDPPEGTLAIVNASGLATSWNALMYMLSVSSNSDRGGPLIFRSSYRRSMNS